MKLVETPKAFVVPHTIYSQLVNQKENEKDKTVLSVAAGS